MAFLVLTRGQATREANRLTIALLRQAIHVRATRVGQAEKTTDLVESFASGIVQRAAQLDDIRRNVSNLQNVRVPARNN